MADIGPPGSFSSIHIRARDFRSKVYSFFFSIFRSFSFLFLTYSLFFLFSLVIITILNKKNGLIISGPTIKTLSMLVRKKKKKRNEKLSFFETHKHKNNNEINNIGEHVYISTDEKNLEEIKVSAYFKCLLFPPSSLLSLPSLSFCDFF